MEGYWKVLEVNAWEGSGYPCSQPFLPSSFLKITFLSHLSMLKLFSAILFEFRLGIWQGSASVCHNRTTSKLSLASSKIPSLMYGSIQCPTSCVSPIPFLLPPPSPFALPPLPFYLPPSQDAPPPTLPPTLPGCSLLPLSLPPSQNNQ